MWYRKEIVMAAGCLCLAGVPGIPLLPKATPVEHYGAACIGKTFPQVDPARVNAALAGCQNADRQRVDAYFRCVAETCRDENGSTATFRSCVRDLFPLSRACKGFLSTHAAGVAPAEQLMDLAWQLTH